MFTTMNPCKHRLHLNVISIVTIITIIIISLFQRIDGGNWNKIRNVFIIFLVSGFWHGANWTFIVWGALNAIYFLPLLITNKNRNNLDTVAHNKYFPNFKECIQMLFTFGLTVLTWIFFRAENMSHALSYFSTIFSHSVFKSSEIFPSGLLLLILFFMSIEWINRNKQYGLEKFNKQKFKFLDTILLFIVFWSIVIWNTNKEVEFIYFQF